MRILIVGDQKSDRKSIEHLLISNTVESFHSINPKDDIQFYIGKIFYSYIIIISPTLTKDDVLNLPSQFSKKSKIIAITNDAFISNEIISLEYSNYKDAFLNIIKSQFVLSQKPKEDILIKIKDKYKRIRLEEIECIKADGKYISLILSDRSYSLRTTLKGISLILPDYFLRTHSSYIVNINKIESINILEQDIELLNSNAPFSRKYKVDILKRFHLG